RSAMKSIPKEALRRMWQHAFFIFMLPFYAAAAASSGGERLKQAEGAQGCAALSIMKEDCAKRSPESDGTNGVDEAEADFELGYRAILKGDRLSAVVYFSKVLEHNPNHSLARQARQRALICSKG